MKKEDFKPGDLVWAKMKGYPPWPAKITRNSGQFDHIAPGRLSVVFFGTHETAIIKKCDIFDYKDHLKEYSLPRKIKGFTEALREIEEASGLATYEIDGNFKAVSRRRCSSKPDVSLSAYKNEQRKRTLSYSLRSATQGSSCSENLENKDITEENEEFSMENRSVAENSRRRRRTSSSSTYSKRRRTISNTNSALLTAADPFLGGHWFDYEKPYCRSRRSTKSSDDQNIRSHHSPSLSISSDAWNLDHFSQDIFPLSPEIPPPFPISPILCKVCGCQCEPYGKKWRCTERSCGEFNGPYDDHSFEEYGDTLNLVLSCGDIVKDVYKIMENKSSPKHQPLLSKTSENETERFLSENNPSTSTRRVKPVLKERSRVVKRNEDEKKPRSYKVTKTPPEDANGVRHCLFCKAHVRPQMCGGRKHRWRCVSKMCRKWYDWVLTGENIPKDLGLKGRWKDRGVIISRTSKSPQRGTRRTYVTNSIRNARRVKTEERRPELVRKSFASRVAGSTEWWKGDYSALRGCSPPLETPGRLIDCIAALKTLSQSMFYFAENSDSRDNMVDILMNTLLFSVVITLTICNNFVPSVSKEMIKDLWQTGMKHIPLPPFNKFD